MPIISKVSPHKIARLPNSSWRVVSSADVKNSMTEWWTSVASVLSRLELCSLIAVLAPLSMANVILIARADRVTDVSEGEGPLVLITVDTKIPS